MFAAGAGHSFDLRRMRRHFGHPGYFSPYVPVTGSRAGQAGRAHKCAPDANGVEWGLVPNKLKLCDFN
jgi:hypothetical protein